MSWFDITWRQSVDEEVAEMYSRLNEQQADQVKFQYLMNKLNEISARLETIERKLEK